MADQAAATQWQWTAESAPKVTYSLVPGDASDWEDDEQSGLAVLDLGLGAASAGALGATKIRARRAGSNRDWEAHELDFQFIYVLAGSLEVETEDGERITLEAGDATYRPRGTRHIENWSSDFEAIQLTSPASFTSTEAAITNADSSRPTYAFDRPDAYEAGKGLRSFMRYRDLNTTEPSGGRIHLHTVGALAPQEHGTGFHYHTMAQIFIVLSGSAYIEVEGQPKHRLKVGDAMCVGAGPGMRHNVSEIDEEYAVIEACIPAEYDTIPTDAPDPVG
jgi:quercetin dioxygenase-like cupin family protein